MGRTLLLVVGIISKKCSQVYYESIPTVLACLAHSFWWMISLHVMHRAERGSPLPALLVCTLRSSSDSHLDNVLVTCIKIAACSGRSKQPQIPELL